MRQVRQENCRGLEDELSSFKKLMKEGKIEVVENPRFMMEARSKELERRQRQKEDSTPVVKEKWNFHCFHARSSSLR